MNNTNTAAQNTQQPQEWNAEADRFVGSMVEHLHAVYGSDPRWSTLLHRSVLRTSKRLCDSDRSIPEESTAIDGKHSTSSYINLPFRLSLATFILRLARSIGHG